MLKLNASGTYVIHIARSTKRRKNFMGQTETIKKELRTGSLSEEPLEALQLKYAYVLNEAYYESDDRAPRSDKRCAHICNTR